jgi:predicted nucleotidyltransferase
MSNRFGLTETDMETITTVLSNKPVVDKAIIFGSRAKGNYKPGSDVDIALKGNDLTFDDVAGISYLLNEETSMPYKFDLLNYHTVKEPELKEHIDRVGIEFYSRWREYRLGEFIDIVNGFAFKSTDFLDVQKPNSLPIIKIKNIANGDVNLDGVHFHDLSNDLNKYIVQKGDILIALTGNHP